MDIHKLISDKKDVKYNDIPLEWRDSFQRFMLGQTIYGDDEGNYIAYYHDFLRWYYENKKVLDRDIKIDSILE